MYIRIENKDEQFAVWAEPEEGDQYIGLCIGVGPTKEAAILDAVGHLAGALKQLTPPSA